MGNAIRDIARTIRDSKAMPLALLALLWSMPVVAQEAAMPSSVVSTMQSPDHGGESTQDYNRRINELARESKTADSSSSARRLSDRARRSSGDFRAGSARFESRRAGDR